MQSQCAVRTHVFIRQAAFATQSIGNSGILTLQVRLNAVECINALLTRAAAAQLPSLTSGLRDPTKAPLLATLFSSLMKASDEEVQKGLTGSKALSAAALRAVGLLVGAVGDGDALAFVLPGLASGLVKVLLAAGRTTCQMIGFALRNLSLITRATEIFLKQDGMKWRSLC